MVWRERNRMQWESLESQQCGWKLGRWEEWRQKRRVPREHSEKGPPLGGGVNSPGNQQPFCYKMEDEEKVGSQKDRSQRNELTGREREQMSQSINWP